MDSLDLLNDIISTEAMNPATADIDLVSTETVLQLINEQDSKVSQAVAAAIPEIAKVVERILEAFRTGHRLLYFGAGTSGRLAILDAAECPPTFGVSPSMVCGFIAGGQAAMTQAVEGAEDNKEAGRTDLLDTANAKPGDVVVGISASGNAPYIAGVLEAARERSIFTAALTCNPEASILEWADVGMVVPVGPEVIAGSTRLKAGTAQKLVLNMLTTASMVGIGKTYGNLMVDVQPTNRKLRIRACRLVSALAHVDEQTAQSLLEQSGYQVKVAVVMAKLHCDRSSAEAELMKVQGKLRRVLEK